jgi:hypothetical protein
MLSDGRMPFANLYGETVSSGSAGGAAQPVPYHVCFQQCGTQPIARSCVGRQLLKTHAHARSHTRTLARTRIHTLDLDSLPSSSTKWTEAPAEYVPAVAVVSGARPSRSTCRVRAGSCRCQWHSSKPLGLCCFLKRPPTNEYFSVRWCLCNPVGCQ